MSATDLATVVEGWATLAGLVVVIAGAVFAGVQLRRESDARRLQAMVTILSDIRPPEVSMAWETVAAVPHGTEFADIPPDARKAAMLVGMSYARLGNLLALGVLREEDVLIDLGLSRGAIEAWEKLEPYVAGVNSFRSSRLLGLTNAIYFEQLALRAQNFLLREGEKRFGGMPHFEADWDALGAMAERVTLARASAH